MYAYVCPVQLHFVIQRMKTITHFLKSFNKYVLYNINAAHTCFWGH